MEIKTINGTILYTCDCATIADALTAAVKSGADLCGADLSRADLRGANLGDADLRYADLCGADLRGADLHGAYFRGADLRCADLHGAYLRGADLRGAYLCGAYLRCADLRYADLCGADLHGADLHGAYFRGADLCGADLRGADLCGADLRCAENIPYIPLACPSDGEFVAWKKVDGRLVRLLIPADARRCSATSRKCRCDKAMVVAITSLDEKEEFSEATSNTYAQLTYRVGEMVYPDSFDEDRWNECSNGIHFFINKQDAINY